MKVSAFAPLLLSTAAFAATRRSHNVVAARQAQLKRDGLVDICAAVDLGVDLLNILPHGAPLLSLDLNVCLCLSLLDDFCLFDSVGKQVSQTLGGSSNATQYLTNAVNKNANKKQCHYPDHCESVCDASDPCHWQCKDGYKYDNAKNPTKCVCPAPMTECNGKCGSFPHGCSSQAASHKGDSDKKRAAAYRKRSLQAKRVAYDVDGLLHRLIKIGVLADCDVVSLEAKVLANVQLLGDDQHCADSIIAYLLKVGLLVDVHTVADVDAKLKAAVGIAKRDFDVVSFLLSLLHAGVLPKDCDLASLEAKVLASVNLGGDDSQCEDGILNFLLGADLLVGVLDIAGVDAKLLAVGGLLKRDYDVLGLLQSLLHLGLLPSDCDLVSLEAKVKATVNLGGDSDECKTGILDYLLGLHLLVGVSIVSDILSLL